MEKFYTKIIGMPIFEGDQTRALTTVKNLVIDPENGKLIALVVNESKNLIVVPGDILSWHEIIKVHDSRVIIEGNDVLRVEEVQKNAIPIVGNRVETKAGKYLGKVFDIAFEAESLVMQKLFVAKGFLGLVRYESRIIPAKNILEILLEKIIVKDDVKTVKEESKEAEVALDEMAVG